MNAPHALAKKFLAQAHSLENPDVVAVKLSETQTAYRFTDQEEEKLKAILRDMAADIETVAGISFNKALATIVK